MFIGQPKKVRSVARTRKTKRYFKLVFRTGKGKSLAEEKFNNRFEDNIKSGFVIMG